MFYLLIFFRVDNYKPSALSGGGIDSRLELCFANYHSSYVMLSLYDIHKYKS